MRVKISRKVTEDREVLDVRIPAYLHSALKQLCLANRKGAAAKLLREFIAEDHNVTLSNKEAVAEIVKVQEEVQEKYRTPATVFEAPSGARYLCGRRIGIWHTRADWDNSTPDFPMDTLVEVELASGHTRTAVMSYWTRSLYNSWTCTHEGRIRRYRIVGE